MVFVPLSLLQASFADFFDINDQSARRKRFWLSFLAALYQFTCSLLLVPPSVGGFKSFLTQLIFFSYMIPMSLYVTLELVRVGQAFFMQWDAHMVYQDPIDPTKVAHWMVGSWLVGGRVLGTFCGPVSPLFGHC